MSEKGKNPLVNGQGKNGRTALRLKSTSEKKPNSEKAVRKRPSSKIAPWERGVRKALQNFVYLAVPVVSWILLGAFGVLESNFKSAGDMVISAILFVLAIPLSIFFRLDQFGLKYASLDETWVVLLVSLLTVLLNFVMIGALRGALRGETEPLPKRSRWPWSKK